MLIIKTTYSCTSCTCCGATTIVFSFFLSMNYTGWHRFYIKIPVIEFNVQFRVCLQLSTSIRIYGTLLNTSDYSCWTLSIFCISLALMLCSSNTSTVFYESVLKGNILYCTTSTVFNYGSVVAFHWLSECCLVWYAVWMVNLITFLKLYGVMLKQVGRLENAIGWYHSHPGYGCWLSGIDVSTQMLNQQFQEPFVAVVVRPEFVVLINLFIDLLMCFMFMDLRDKFKVYASFNFVSHGSLYN